jgi:hypothetical protein
MVDPKKWAEGIEQSRAQTANLKSQEQASFVARREIFKEEAPKLWPVLRAAFNKFCDAYNEKRDVLYIADIGPYTFVVRRKDIPGVALTVERLGDHKLCVTGNSTRGTKLYEPEVFQNGHGSVSYTLNGAPITPEGIAASALESVAQM